MYEVLEKALDNAMHIGEIPKGNAKFHGSCFRIFIIYWEF